jgi:hypothetical protein
MPSSPSNRSTHNQRGRCSGGFKYSGQLLQVKSVSFLFGAQQFGAHGIQANRNLNGSYKAWRRLNLAVYPFLVKLEPAFSPGVIKSDRQMRMPIFCNR